MDRSDHQDSYFPPLESAGGWRVAGSADRALELAGMDLDALEPAHIWNAATGFASSVLIIRHGYVVAEWFEQGSLAETRYYIASASKSFSATAYGIMFEDARQGKLAGKAVELDSPAHDYIPRAIR